MKPAQIEAIGDTLYEALRTRTTLDPLTTTHADITIDDAYGISKRILARRLASGEQLIGKKIGVTSPAVQNMLGVHQPDFGFLTDRMRTAYGKPMPIGSELIQPRAEGELAFVLSRSLSGPGVTEADVVAATDHVAPCFEIVDSRIRDWRIAIQDTVADNASCGLFVIGEDRVTPGALDLTAHLPGAEMVVHKNGAELSRGFGSAALGSPLTCVAWLANTLGRYGITLDAGDVVLSGSWVPLEPVVAGDEMHLTIEGIGSCRVRFS